MKVGKVSSIGKIYGMVWSGYEMLRQTQDILCLYDTNTHYASLGLISGLWVEMVKRKVSGKEQVYR